MPEAVPFVEELAIAAAMIAGTVFFHAVVISALAAVFRATSARVWGPLRFFRDAFVLAAESLVLMAAHTAEVFAWSLLFLKLDAFRSLEESFYFSGVAYSTLGFGDVLLPDEWRILAGSLAANGMLLFGLSAAFLLESASRLRIGEEH
ncbi:MAG: two pore domain potassium channel family protein [Parvularculaceae bacterium]|nr:two pore domain potassium channel family protein [Parvularculaceae bacterium]